MTLSNTHDRYGSVAKVFHWLTALLIVTVFVLGTIAYRTEVTPETLPRIAQLFSLHKTLGLATFAVALMRIGWAVIQPKPALLNAEKKLESFLAETAHWLLYASLVIVPLSGWLHHAATEGFAPILWPFGQSLPLVPKSVAVAEVFGAWHFVFTKILGVTVLLHVAGALKHHVIDRDATLRRMWFGASQVEGLPPEVFARAPIIAAMAIYLAALGVASALAFGDRHDAVATAPAAEVVETTGTWAVQDGSLAITVRQLGSDVGGSFSDWSAEIVFDEAAAGPVKGRVDVRIAIGSLTIGSVTAQALAPEFFDAETFPTASYAGEIVETEAGYRVAGLLSLKGVEAEVPLDFTLAIAEGVARVEGGTTMDRRSFGIGVGYDDESSVGFDVGVSVSLTAIRPEG